MYALIFINQYPWLETISLNIGEVIRVHTSFPYFQCGLYTFSLNIIKVIGVHTSFPTSNVDYIYLRGLLFSFVCGEGSFGLWVGVLYGLDCWWGYQQKWNFLHIVLRAGWSLISNISMQLHINVFNIRWLCCKDNIKT